MNYYFFVILDYCLGVRLCNSLPTRGLLLDFHNNTNNQSLIKQYCQRFITYNQVAALLSRNTCPSLEKSKKIKNNNDRTRRQVDAGNIDIKALQTTVNDHRTTIEYLFNNSINETILAKAFDNHSRKGPSLNSWRDLVDIFCISLFLIMMIYVLACRAGFSVCDRMFTFFFQPVHDRLQQQQQQKQQQQQQQLEQQQQLQKQQQIQQQQQRQHPKSIYPTAPPTTTSDHLHSLSKIADGIQPNRIRTQNTF